MSPGYHTTRYNSRSQQEIRGRDVNDDIEQQVFTHSDEQVVHTTRFAIAQKKHPNATTPIAGEKETVTSHTGSGKNVIYKRRKATHGMRTSKIAKASSTGKLSVVFDANCRQPICANAERFNNEIGLIVLSHGTFIKKENFDIDLSDKTTRECIDDQMRKASKSYRYKLHLYFKRIGGESDVEMAKKKRYADLNEDQQKDWEFLCDCWSAEHFKERARKNSENQAKRKWASRYG
ncbi:hypothetical protein AgCh_017468 [Apium graveolens]